MNNLEDLKNVDIRTVDRDTLVDIQTIVIDETLPQKDRLESFIKQIKNPYCFKCGKIVVKVKFADNGDTLEDRIKKMILI